MLQISEVNKDIQTLNSAEKTIYETLKRMMPDKYKEKWMITIEE